MNRAKSVLLIFSLLFSGESLSETHCHRGEITYFSCQIQKSKKVVSLCGAAFRSRRSDGFLADAWIQYRFGVVGNVELEFPKRRDDSLSLFGADMFLADNSRRIYALHFSVGKYKYSIERILADSYVNAVLVEGSGKETEFRCAGEPKMEDVAGENGFESLVEALYWENKQG